MTWEDYVKQKCSLSRERAHGLIRIGAGRTSLSEVRERAASVPRNIATSNRCYVTPADRATKPKRTAITAEPSDNQSAIFGFTVFLSKKRDRKSVV